MKPTIYLASDHAGFELKQELIAYVRDELGYAVHDHGAHTYDPEDDFTDFVAQTAREVSASPTTSLGIILGGSGQGEAMLANRFHDVRAVVYYGGDMQIISLSREHNDANVLSLGARFVSVDDAKKAVALWLSTPHNPKEKYDRRIEEMESMSLSGAALTTAVTYSLVPSYPAESYEALAEVMTKLEGSASGMQIDMVDGQFVPAISWPFTEKDVASAVTKLERFKDSFVLEADCMCLDPLQYLDTFVRAGFKRIVIHMESTDAYSACIAHKQEHGYMLGFAITNDTPLQVVDAYIDDVDFIQVMGIKEVGKQGEPFDERTLSTVTRLRSRYPHLEIAVDGAVNTVTLPLLKRAGATRFAPGSAIVHAPDVVDAYEQLSSMLDV